MIINILDSEKNINKFNKNVKSGLWFVWYYADWCGHCTSMQEDWDQLLEINNVNYSKINYTYLNKIKLKHQPVHGYPTLRVYNDGKFLHEYNNEENGLRNIDNFKIYVNNYLPKLLKKHKIKKLKRKKSKKKSSKSKKSKKKHTKK